MSLAAGQSAAQVAGTGTVVSIGGLTGGATTTFTAIGEISDFKSSGRKRGTTPVTNFDSLGIVRKLGTTLDLGQVDMTVNRVSDNAGQEAVIAANLQGGAYDFKVQLPINPDIGQTTTGDLVTFSGIVTEAGDFDISLTKASEYTFSVDLNSWTVTAGS